MQGFLGFKLKVKLEVVKGRGYRSNHETVFNTSPCSQTWEMLSLLDTLCSSARLSETRGTRLVQTKHSRTKTLSSAQTCFLGDLRETTERQMSTILKFKIVYFRNSLENPNLPRVPGAETAAIVTPAHHGSSCWKYDMMMNISEPRWMAAKRISKINISTRTRILFVWYKTVKLGFNTKQSFY